MKKVVLVVDHRERDLKGLVLIAFWLNAKYGIHPFITNTKNEISCLIKHKPDLILLQHVRHHHQKEYLEFAKAQNTAISILLAEGFPLSEEDFLFSAGRDEYVPYVDLFLTWGRIFNRFIEQNRLTRHSTTVNTGSPRFDYHTPRYKSLVASKDEFYKVFNINPEYPVILWMSSTMYANPVGGYDNFIKKMKDPNTSDSRIAPIIDKLAKDHQTVFDIMSAYFKKLAAEFPQVNFMVKPHPAESRDVYDNEFKSYTNIKIISGSPLSLSDLLRHIDIQLNWRCTTATESWLTDINNPVISIEPDGLNLDIFKYLSIGNDIVSDYSSLQEKVSHYLQGGEVSHELIEKRQQFIDDYLCVADGKSSERCADAISSYISQGNSVSWSFNNYKILIKYLRRYRFNKNWLAMKRDHTHPKYISHKSIHQEMGKLMKLHNKKVEYTIEM